MQVVLWKHVIVVATDKQFSGRPGSVILLCDQSTRKTDHLLELASAAPAAWAWQCGLCAFHAVFWHSRLQYNTAWHWLHRGVGGAGCSSL